MDIKHNDKSKLNTYFNLGDKPKASKPKTFVKSILKVSLTLTYSYLQGI
jgi:hypothetical protein